MVNKRKLILPDNPKVKDRLKRKIKEYYQRMKRLKSESSFTNPEMVYTTLTGYKALIAQRLTLCGEVDTEALSRELREEYGFVNYEDFNNAIGVIEDYCKTGGQNCCQGTGF